jgi:hypothetical protein
MTSLRRAGLMAIVMLSGMVALPIGCGTPASPLPPPPSDVDGGVPPTSDGSIDRTVADVHSDDVAMETSHDVATGDTKTPDAEPGESGDAQPTCSEATPCAAGLPCVTAQDCTSKVCTGSICQAPTCTDGVKNGNETDIDCGGGTCPACIVGKQCVIATDCTSDLCTNSTCSCPVNMVILPTNLPTGGDYCVDYLEVTYSDYNTFWTSNPSLATQPNYCTWNTTWTPANGWPPDLVTTDPGYNGGNPVNWVNWCQAYGYCVQQGKHLCGNLAGGPNPTADSANALESQWFNACSADGVNTYPYGGTYQPGRCNDVSAGVGAPWQELNSNQQLVNDQCQGGASGLYQMSGDVAEWENSCNGTSGATDTCLLRGGSYNSSATELTCAAAVAVARNYQGGDSGFRCCL